MPPSDIGIYLSRHLDPNSVTPPASRIGEKASGLFGLPTAWTLPFIAVDIECCRRIRKATASERKRLLSDIVSTVTQSIPLPQKRGDIAWGYYLRSSLVDEDISERGQQISQFDLDLTAESLGGYLDHLFDQAKQKASQVAIVIQRGAEPDRRIHFSNERRVSKTQNEWLITQEMDAQVFVAPEGCNSTKAPTLNEDCALALLPGQLQRDLRLNLRGLGKWATKRYSHRVHFEIVLISGNLYVVQVDAEKDLGGTDPRSWPQRYTKGHHADGVFQRYELSNPSGFSKLDNLRDFQAGSYEPPHALYFATGRSIDAELKSNADAVLDQLRQLTHDRLVVREDINCDAPGGHKFNLFRSDTIDATTAIKNLRHRIEFWSQRGINLNNVAFIIHAFVPAISSAWAMYSNRDRRVRIHALWGLPDGLQFLTPDEYELDLATGHWSSRVHFKEFCLLEEEDGSWRREAVSLAVARKQVLSANQRKQIAEITIPIAEKLGTDVHIMFFCGLPKEAGMGEVLPWYRAREFQEYEAKREKRLRRVNVQSLNDLKNANQPNVAISLNPDVENYRDNEFLKKVASFAVNRGIPIELAGSPLAHAYYLLRKEGCTVFTSFAPSYERVRNKRQFGKLVRDKITEKISKSGERNISFSLPEDHKDLAFFAKIIEESIEVMRARDQNERLEEFADLYEVIRGWISGSSFDIREIEVAASEKRQKLGGFDKGEVLVETGIKSQDLAATRLTFSEANRIRQEGDRAIVTAGRLSYLAKGEPLSLTLGDEKHKIGITLSINHDGELIITSGMGGDVPDSEQLQFMF